MRYEKAEELVNLALRHFFVYGYFDSDQATVGKYLLDRLPNIKGGIVHVVFVSLELV